MLVGHIQLCSVSRNWTLRYSFGCIWLAEEVTLLANDIYRRFNLCVVHAVSNFTSSMNRVLRSWSSSSKNLILVLLAVLVDIMLSKMLSTERTYNLKFFKFTSISIYKSSPFIHFVSGLFIKLVLIIVILLFQLLWKLPNYIVFEFKQFPLFFVVIHQHSALGKLTRQVVWEDVYFNFKVFCNWIFNVFVQLAILVQKLKWVRLLRHLISRVSLVTLHDFLHGHKYFIDSSYVLLYFCDIMLQHS